MACVINTITCYPDYGLAEKELIRRLANVLLNGLHKLEKDRETNSKLYQTTIKKARLAD